MGVPTWLRHDRRGGGGLALGAKAPCEDPAPSRILGGGRGVCRGGGELPGGGVEGWRGGSFQKAGAGAGAFFWVGGESFGRRIDVCLLLRPNINATALLWRLAITSMDSGEKGSNNLHGQLFGSTRHALPSKVHVRCSVNDTQPLTACRHIHIRLGARFPRGTAELGIAGSRERKHRALYVCPGVWGKYRPRPLW
jgi:hypothetical protein